MGKHLYGLEVALMSRRWFRNPGGGFGFRAHENIGSMDMMGEERDDEDFGEHEDEEEDVLGYVHISLPEP